VVIGGIGYSRGKWEVDMLGRWQSSYLDFRFNANRTVVQPIDIDIDSYVTLTARIGYRLSDNLSLALTAQQFNQSQLLETAGPPVEQRIIATVTVRL